MSHSDSSSALVQQPFASYCALRAAFECQKICICICICLPEDEDVLCQGANCTLRNKAGQTALDLAQLCQNAEAIQLLEQAQPAQASA